MFGQPCKKEDVDFVASLLAESAEILYERRFADDSVESSYEAEEVPLDQSPTGVLGKVTYFYDVSVSPGYPATYDSPAENPEPEIGKLTGMDIVGYDDQGNEISPTPEQLKMWQEAAADYFNHHLISKVRDYEFDNMRSGAYDYGDYGDY